MPSTPGHSPRSMNAFFQISNQGVRRSCSSLTSTIAAAEVYTRFRAGSYSLFGVACTKCNGEAGRSVDQRTGPCFQVQFRALELLAVTHVDHEVLENVGRGGVGTEYDLLLSQVREWTQELGGGKAVVGAELGGLRGCKDYAERAKLRHDIVLDIVHLHLAAATIVIMFNPASAKLKVAHAHFDFLECGQHPRVSANDDFPFHHSLYKLLYAKLR